MTQKHLHEEGLLLLLATEISFHQRGGIMGSVIQSLEHSRYCLYIFLAEITSVCSVVYPVRACCFCFVLVV